MQRPSHCGKSLKVKKKKKKIVAFKTKMGLLFFPSISLSLFIYLLVCLFVNMKDVPEGTPRAVDTVRVL